MLKRFLSALAASSLLMAGGCVQREQPQPAQQPKAQRPAPQAQNTRTAIAPVDMSTLPTVKIALLLPLSGDSVGLGNAMLDAASLALYDKYLSLPSEQAKVRVVLLPKDTGASPQHTAEVAQQAMEQGATLIIGPLYSQSVTAIAPLAQQRNVPVITFSNNAQVASTGVYVFGFLPEQQIERVTEYAVLHDVQRLAALAPNDSYGKAVTDALSAAAKKKGGSAQTMEFYANKPELIDAAAGRLASAYNTADATYRFQGLLLPDGGEKLRSIVQSVSKQNIDMKSVKLLGTGVWDDQETLKIPETKGGWFASSPPERYKQFESRFQAAYGYKPQRLASLAYDAVALATSLALAPSGPDFTNATLTDPRGYLGPANGVFRFLPSGMSERGLAVMEVTPSGFKVIDPAPQNF